VLERVREQNGVWRPEESGSPADRDLVSVKILRIDGAGAPLEDAEWRDYDFVLGQGDAIPDIEAAIKGLEPGGTGEFDVTFPDDFPDEGRRGAVERVRIELTGRRVLDLPALDDDLAKQVGDFESLDDLKTKIRADMEREAQDASESGVRSRLLDLLIEANPFDVPHSMVDRYATAVIGDQGIPDDRKAEVLERIRPEAERAVKRLLVVDRVAEKEGLSATDDEIDARVEEIAGASQSTAAKVYAELQKAGRLEAIERDLTESKVFGFLKEKSKIIDAPAA
jgi:trigger factor